MTVTQLSSPRHSHPPRGRGASLGGRRGRYRAQGDDGARADEGLWIIRNRFAPGVVVQRHRHTGPVYGYTVSGAWKYAEYPEVNRAGSFLFEPAGSVHTLTVPADNTEPTEVWFQMYGVNLNLDAHGNVESVTDGPGVLAAYYALCEAQGHPRPDVVT